MPIKKCYDTLGRATELGGFFGTSQATEMDVRYGTYVEGNSNDDLDLKEISTVHRS
jgi:hypothetical protein